ncbi:MAG: flagellar hook assembly protein FlgD [Pseudomonadota bacterium]
MELGGIRTASSQAQQAPETSGAGQEELGKNQFLELMVAQFNNQDPLEPTKNEDFVAQLAQFSSLEGIQNLNGTVESMAAAMRSTTTLQAASLVGRSVLAPAPRAHVGEQGVAGNVVNDQGSAPLTVDVTAPGGELVRRLELGTAAEGPVHFEWDGTDADGEPLPEGSYGFKAYAATSDGPVELDVELPEQVVSVSIEQGQAMLNLAGGASVALSSIKELQ